MTHILDYVWVNEDYKIVMESIENDSCELYPYWCENIMIKPKQSFKNPFRSESDLIVFCDMYYINNLKEPPEIIIAEHNQRNEFEHYMSSYEGDIFQIIQTYKNNRILFRKHKEMCSYMGIDMFSKPGEFKIYTEKKNVYNYIWITRYILYQISNEDIEWDELLLISNEEENITNSIKQMNVSTSPMI